MKRSLLLLALPLLLAVAVALISLRSFERSGTAPLQADSQRPRYTLRDAEWTRFDAQGRTEFHIAAAGIDYFDDQSAQLRTMTMDRLDAGRGPWTLSAPDGTVPARERRVLLTQPVTMTGRMRDGDTLHLTTRQLWVDSDHREIYTEAPVQLSGSGKRASASGMRADWAGEKVQLLHDVKVDYAPHG